MFDGLAKQLAFVLALGLAPLTAHALLFNPFVTTTDLNATLSNSSAIGFAYAGNKFVGSVYFGPNNNQLYQVGLGGGTVSLFGAPIPNAGGEIYVSSSLGLGGFPSRDIYASQGNGVYRITNGGTNVGTFVGSLAGGVRGIAFDPYGLYGNDMIVTTNVGTVYRVNAAGTATPIASNLGDVEGLDFAPQAFGPHPAGTLFVMSESSGNVTAIAPDMTTTTLAGISIPVAEMLSFIPANLGVSGSPLEGFYAASYPLQVVKADAPQFVPFIGDAIATTESNPGQVWRIHWNGTSFEQISLGGFPNQPEDGIFVTASILNPGCERTNSCGPREGSVPEPSVVALLLMAVLAFASRRRR